MNNPYQNPQYRPPPPPQGYHPPAYQQYQPIPNQVVPGRGSYHQNNSVPNSQHSMPHSSPHNSQHPPLPNHQQFDKYANTQNPNYRGNIPGQSQPIYFPPPQSAVGGLIPPPQLRQQPRDSASQIAKNSNIHNQKANQNQLRDIVWGEQQQNNTFWQQKFFMIYQKFEWFGQRFEMIKGDYYTLSQQLQIVDSEEDWNELKHHHEQFAQKLQEMFQELIAVADENQQLISQRLGQEGQGVWQRRYHQLLSNFKALQQQNKELQTEIQNQRNNQSGNQEQSQNYQELLTHYRTLEQQCERLYTEYNKVQAQNQRLLKNPQSAQSVGPSAQDFESMRQQYEKNLELMQNQYDHLKGQCQQIYEEKEHLRNQIQSNPHGASNEQLEHLHHVAQQQQIQLQAISKQADQYKGKCFNLQNDNKQLLLQYKNKYQTLIQQNSLQIQNLKSQAFNKQQQISTLKSRIQQQIKNKQKYIHQHKEQIGKVIKLEEEKYNRLKISLQQQLKTLKEQVQHLHRDKSSKDLNQYQIESLQNKIKFLKEQNQEIHNVVKSKNQQLISLRSISLQLTTYENVLEQYKTVQKDKLILEETNRKQHNELLSVKKKLSEVQHQFLQYKNFVNSTQSRTNTSGQIKQLQDEISKQKQNSLKFQSQINKYRQLSESKENYIKDLQNQNLKVLSRLQHQSNILQVQKIQYQNQITNLNRRIQTLEKRYKSAQTQFKKQITENYERQIKQLRKGNQEKLKKIKSLEQQLHQFKSRSTHLQKNSSKYHQQQELLKKKIQSLQQKNNDLMTKIQLSKSSSHSLEEQLQLIKQKELNLRTQLGSYAVQMEEADSLIKNKNNIIVDYQKQVNQFIEKISGLEKRIDAQKKERLQKVKRYDEQIEKLKQRLYTSNEQSGRDKEGSAYLGNRYSSLYSSNRYLSFGTKQPMITNTIPRNEEIVKLQNNIIEQLNEQNSKLRNEMLEMNKKLNELQTLSRVVANMEQSKQNSPSKSKINNPNIPERDLGSGEVQQRLMRFNQRLESCIQDNQLLSMGGVDLTASQRIAYHQRQKRQLEIKYQKQIRILVDQINSLQQQIAQQKTLVNQNTRSSQKKINTLQDSELKEFDKYNIMSEQAQKSLRQELQFLRSKLNQQTKTNSSLIKLNQQIKKQLEEYLQSNKHSTTEYYKMQWKQSQKSLLEQKQKNKKLNQQNKKLKHENLEHDTKLAKEYELKIFEMQLKLKDLERQNVYLNINRTKGQNERANLLHDVNVYSADVEAIKSSMQTRISQYEKVNSQLRGKCTNLENQLMGVNQNIVINNSSSSALYSPHHKRQISKQRSHSNIKSQNHIPKIKV